MRRAVVTALGVVLVLASIGLASLTLWGQPSGVSGTTNNQMAVDADANTPLQVDAAVLRYMYQSFDVGTNIVEAPTAYAAYQMFIEFDPSVLDFVPQGTYNIVYTTLGGMGLFITSQVPPPDHDADGLPEVEGGAVRISGTTYETGQANVVRFQCIGPGTSSLHLLTSGESAPLFSTTLRIGGTTIPTTLVDASVTCAVPYSVNSTGDGGDSLPGNWLCDDGAGHCTLRAAIQEANADGVLSTIIFNIGGGGVQTITPDSALPMVTAPVVIDGTTQPGYPGTPIIELNGSSAGTETNGLYISAGNTTVRGLVINRFDGTGIRLTNAGGNVIEGNYIGTDVSGTLALGNYSGVFITNDSDNNIIGGTTPAARNLISGNMSSGIEFGSAPGAEPTGNQIRGNFIGTKANGTQALGNLVGVWIVAAPGNTIGGTASGEGNTIAFNGGDGVAVSSGTGNVIRRNSIFSNTGLGIELAPDGVTPNDTGDGDTGPNNLQNFPVVTSVVVGSTTVQGTLNSTANTQFTLEFFYSSSCDPSGNGEGENFLGSTTETTNGSGDAPFTVVFPDTVPLGRFITATATDPGGNTSEFSGCIPAAGPTPTPTPMPTPTPTPIPMMSHLAGTGTGGYNPEDEGQPAAGAQVNGPQGMFDTGTANTIYFADTNNHRIRKITGDKIINTVVGGNLESPDYCGDGGPATSACLNYPRDVFLDGDHNIYVADTDNHRIRVVNVQGQSIVVAGVTIDPGDIETVAGNGTDDFCGDDGSATSACLHSPSGVAVDEAGNIYIADTDNHCIRRVDAALGTITTFVGTCTEDGYAGDGGLATLAHLNLPHDVYPYGSMYAGTTDWLIADTGNNVIRWVHGPSGIINTLAGTGDAGPEGDDGPAIQAHLWAPQAVTADASLAVFVADTENNRIRRFGFGEATITTFAGGASGPGCTEPCPAKDSKLDHPAGVAAAGSLVIANTGGAALSDVDPAIGEPVGSFGNSAACNTGVATADFVFVVLALGLILVRKQVRALLVRIGSAAGLAPGRRTTG